jgi:hypothetical protein
MLVEIDVVGCEGPNRGNNGLMRLCRNEVDRKGREVGLRVVVESKDEPH